MLTIEIGKINLEANTIAGGTKTKAGKDRVVPIHSKIRGIVERRLETSEKYLFSHNSNRCSDSTYWLLWQSIMKSANREHTPHGCRHIFRSRLDSAGANKKCIDMMMGHKSKDVGERVYTHKTIDELKTAIELVTD